MGKVIKYVCFFWIQLSIGICLQGQRYFQPSNVQVEELGVNQGLSQGMINCIYQDREGYLWICTKDGLNRYDGYHITTYRNDVNDPYSLPDNYCNCIVEDDKGNLWIGTNTKGLFLFEKTSKRYFSVPTLNESDLCIKELEYAHGKLFVKKWTDALILDIKDVTVDKNSPIIQNYKVIFSYNENQPNPKYRLLNNFSLIHACSWLPQNVLYVSMQDSIFCFILSPNSTKWECKSLTPKYFDIKENTNGVVYFFQVKDNLNHLLIAHKNTIRRIDIKTGKTIYSTSLPFVNDTPNQPNRYYMLNDGNVYTLTNSNAYIYNPKSTQIESFSTEFAGMSYGYIISLFTDSYGIQWLGSNGSGIIKRDPRKKTFKSFKNVHPSEVFIKLPPELMPGIWPSHFLIPEFNRIKVDDDGVLWALMQRGNVYNKSYLYSFDTKTGKSKIYSAFSNTVSGFSLFIDPKNRLWMYYVGKSNKNYIALIDKKNATITSSYEIPECIDSPEPYVSQYYQDKNDIMWLATINGLYSFQETTNQWKHWKNIVGNNTSLSSNGVLSICPDPNHPDQYLWLGTEGAGINKFEKSTGICKRFDTKDGLPNNVAYCILQDSFQNLWISTNKGLSCFNPVKKTFSNFTSEDGLPGNEFNRSTAMTMGNGELMFGGVGGFVIFNPREVLQKQAASPITFTNVTVLNKPVNWKECKGNVTSTVECTNSITLQPGQNIFNISFASLEFRSNSKKLYQYKLDGFDEDWSPPSHKNDVTYTNLSPGTYMFYVMGANTDGVWNEKPITLEVVVLPFWYQTRWFRLMMFLLVAGSTYAFYRYRLQQGLKIEKLRGRIARDLHDEIGSSLSSISLYSASAKLVTKGNAKAEQILEKINANTTEMMEAMSDIVWAVNAGNDNIEDLANRLRTFAVMVTEAKKINLIFTDNNDIPNVLLNMEQRKNIYLICKEAISNAVKYSSCTLLSVGISAHNKHLHIIISDNGQGFFINKESSNSLGHSMGGNGLKNMRSRAEEIGASLTINSILNSSTQISVTMPI